MKAKSLVVCLFAASLLQGCTLAKIYATSGNDISLTQVGKAGVGEPIKLEHRLVFDYTGAIDAQELLRARYGSGHKFSNVSVKIKADAVDVLLNIFTFGLARAQTFEISGDKIG